MSWKHEETAYFRQVRGQADQQPENALMILATFLPSGCTGEMMSEIREIEWIVRRDGVETARFLTQFDADEYADQIREAEAIKGFHMHVDVVPDGDVQYWEIGQ